MPAILVLPQPNGNVSEKQMRHDKLNMTVSFIEPVKYSVDALYIINYD